jgi:UDP-perosamine 4-acetyltransferase
MIYGGGMLGKQVGHLMLNHYAGRHNLCGFIDDVLPPGVDVIDGITTLGSLADVSAMSGYGPESKSLVFAIGYSDMRARGLAVDKVRPLGYDMISLIHPAASVEPSARLGEGVVVLAGAVVDQYVTIGDFCYLHNGSIVGENSVLGANNYLSAGTTFGGSVTVGANNFFGINSTIVNDVDIGDNNFINAASLVYKPVGDNLNIVEFREQREVRHDKA